MAKLGSGSVVTALTAGALAVVAMLAVQAKSSASTTTASGAGGKAPAVSASSKPGTKATPDKPVAVPKDSGSGKRVVYSVGQKRVWLVDPAQSGATRTFTVQPGTLDPAPGSYAVMSTEAGPATGSDGKKVENIVRFTTRGGLFIGFSAAVDGSTPAPDPARKTGGIRETVADGQALFAFAPFDTKVVVVA
ncbi:hypothetical protein [Streptacidiphilus jiangxiensis]|uniref:L,D-transpeptidase catalytic domain n=1 Tax=Streptacidiphilus jiangxiensis TaxID=235985 RepID=A0A1H7M8B8_STRJI|nr:hypothetical protein [Streptacidiphilus jiangxiensis]SEL07329.1 hypothetical protein SAMN05414137_105233 [Streptacidiphilus jiangxiensis]